MTTIGDFLSEARKHGLFEGVKPPSEDDLRQPVGPSLYYERGYEEGYNAAASAAWFPVTIAAIGSLAIGIFAGMAIVDYVL